MGIKKRIVRKKKKNEASEALAKISGVKELEMAATILKDLAERKERKEKIDNKIKQLKNKSKEKPKEKVNKKLKRIQELDSLRKTGIITKKEFEKLKSDLLNQA
ncbi:MAG: hypothetical protein CMB06_02735 [Euryarchaeota archaeon]|nr:hypothetical protein [Euryarchaeota archaeon]|tara:strand:+ start:3811 stop:4122 length:312 start_codon:yes stop_codon:yes gene_type:complete